MASLNDIETKIQNIICILGTKNITGILPLTFTTAKAGAVDTWTIFGNDDNGTENLFDAEIQQGGWSGSPGNQPTKYNISTRIRSSAIFLSPTMDTYTISVYPDTLQVSVLICDNDGKVISNSGWSTNNYITVNNLVQCAIVIKNASGTDISPSDIEGVCIVKGSTVPDHYIPYQKGVGEQRQDGYYVPMTISQTGQTDKTVDIFIGENPLTEGETVSKTSTGIDLELFEGENTISTTLYNKPVMKINYKWR